jgi:hypothetical protein
MIKPALVPLLVAAMTCGGLALATESDVIFHKDIEPIFSLESRILSMRDSVFL